MSSSRPAVASGYRNRRLGPYPAYLDSGVEWLGEIPAHWQLPRMKGQTRNVVQMTRSCPNGDSYLALEHVESWTGCITDTDAEMPANSQVKRFAEDDVLFGKLRPYLAKVTRAVRRGVCVGEFLVLRCRTEHLRPSFLEYWLRSPLTIDLIDSSTHGAKMPRADWQFVGSLRLALPPPREQELIAAYLDRETGRIDGLVERQRALIDLLRERRAALIHRAVTRGLDPDVPMVDSGVEWLGEIPAHWGLSRIKDLAQDVVQMTRSCRHGEPYLALEHVESWTGRITDGDVEVPTGSQVKRFGRDDVLFGKLRPYLAKVVRATQTGVCVGEFLVLRPHMEQLVAPFLEYWFRSPVVIGVIDASTHGARMPRADWGFIGSTPLALPLPCEQQRIAAYVDRETGRIDALIERQLALIELLREKRAALITAAVTGQIDVRGLVPDDDQPPAGVAA